MMSITFYDNTTLNVSHVISLKDNNNVISISMLLSRSEKDTLESHIRPGALKVLDLITGTKIFFDMTPNSSNTLTITFTYPHLYLNKKIRMCVENYNYSPINTLETLYSATISGPYERIPVAEEYSLLPSDSLYPNESLYPSE